MDITLYYEILKWREEDPYKTDDTSNKPQQMGVSIFHKDILLNKAVWTNRKRRDFKYWLQSFHPIIGLISAPKYHIYSKQYRLANISLLLFIGAFWSILSSYYAQLLLNISTIGYNLEYIKLLLISFINSILLCIIEYIFIKTKCFQSCFKFIVSIPGCVLITISIISILASMVVAVELYFVRHYLFILCTQFIFLWLFQFIYLYFSFLKQWKFDHSLLESDNNINSEMNIKSSINKTDKVSMVTVSPKNPYYVTLKDYQEYIAQRGVDNMDISLSNDNDDSHSNNLVLGYTPPNNNNTDAPLLSNNSL